LQKGLQKLKDHTMVDWARWRHKYNITARTSGHHFLLGPGAAGCAPMPLHGSTAAQSSLPDEHWKGYCRDANSGLQREVRTGRRPLAPKAEGDQKNEITKTKRL